MMTILKYKPYILSILLCLPLLFIIRVASSQVMLSTENINSSLKEVQRLLMEIDDVSNDGKPELLFKLGTEAKDLASRLTNQRSEYGEENQSGLIQLVQTRIENLGLNIQWMPDKGRYYYDGLAFNQYLELAEDGEYAQQATYQLIEIRFFKSEGNNLELLQDAVRKKQEYILRYPDADNINKVRIMLAIEIRDISRIFISRSNAEKAKEFIEIAINEAAKVAASAPGSKEAETAKILSNRMSDEAHGWK